MANRGFVPGTWVQGIERQRPGFLGAALYSTGKHVISGKKHRCHVFGMGSHGQTIKSRSTKTCIGSRAF